MILGDGDAQEATAAGWIREGTVRDLTPDELTDLSWLASFPGAEACVFEVTATQLQKGIVDATGGIRGSFSKTRFHDFDLQGKGQKQHGVMLPMGFVGPGGVVETSLSLYRPETKAGDPRLWIHRLVQISQETKPGDLVAIVQDGTSCVGLNLTRVGTFRASASRELDRVFPAVSSPESGAAAELLERLYALAHVGPLPALRAGDTAVGHAIETALGIVANSRKAPDFKGIEIKSSRAVGTKRDTLFSQVPDWKASPVKGPLELMDRYGYPGEHGKRLYCTVSGKSPNPQGLYLEVDFGDGVLLERASREGSDEVALIWDLDVLTERFAGKHHETFWIDAREEEIGGERAFRLLEVMHTKEPNLTALAVGLADGSVTLDHTISTRSTGAARDHGYLFRALQSHRLQLVQLEAVYDLTT